MLKHCQFLKSIYTFVHMSNLKRYFPALLLILFWCLGSQEVYAQCAMCKQAAESSLKSDAGSIARGLNSGILYLMAVPYLMIAFIFRKQLVKLFRLLKAKVVKPRVQA